MPTTGRPRGADAVRPNRRGASTSLDVARLAGVSQSAVSRAFTPGASVAPQTRERVLAAARALGYQPNAIARTLITRRSRIVAVVVSYLENQFYPVVLERMAQRLQRDGYHLLLFTSASSAADEVLPQLRQYQVDAIVLVSTTLSSAIAAECAATGVPVVMFNRVDADGGCAAVESDNEAGGRLAARTLLESGHRRIGFIAGREDTSTSRDREQGLRRALHAAALTIHARAVGGFSFDGARVATRSLFARGRRPDALFVANDHMAFAVIDCLRGELGLRVPEDVSVIGFDDVPQAAWGGYRLTTIAQDADAMVDATVGILLARLREPGGGMQRVRVPVRLVVRDTVRGLAGEAG